jgi:sorbitol-specific phosphotransferase system component IIA
LQASAGVPGGGNEIIIGLDDGSGTFYVFVLTAGGYQIVISGSPIGSRVGYSGIRTFSMYSDSVNIHFMVDGNVVETQPIVTTNPYQLKIYTTNIDSTPETITDIRFYPTGKLGPTGETGPTGPGFTTIANAGDNRVLTSDGTSNAANAETDLTFDGTYLAAPYLNATNSSGDEGGEILLSKPQTNTTLSGTGITIDAWQNRLRFFEQGGSARGAYIDITACGAGASTNLLSGGGGGGISLTNGTNNYVVTAVDSTTVNGEVNMQFDGSTLTVSGNVNYSGAISNSVFNTANVIGGVLLSNGFLDVSRGTASAPSYSFLQDAASGMFQPAANQLAFTTAGIQRMIVSNANVGIGIATPSTLLDVCGDVLIGGSVSSNLLRFRGTTGDLTSNFTVIAERIYNSTERSELILFKGNDVTSASGPDRIRLRAAEHRFQTYTSTEDWSGLQDNNDRLTILEAGNVGIGTVSPITRLDVSGFTRINADTTTSLTAGNALSSTGVGQFRIDTIADVSTALAGRKGRLVMGFDTTTNAQAWGTAFIQSVVPDTFANPLILQPAGGRLGIGFIGLPGGALDVSASTANPVFFRTPTYMRVPIQDISAAATTSATVSLETSGLYYNITNSGFNTISLIPSITTASAGAFWVFRNNTAGTLSVTISNRGTAPSTIGTPISIPSSNSITIAVSAFSNDCYVLL